MANPIETAVAPLKADAMARAEQEANKVLERIRANLEANGNDLFKAAPVNRCDYGHVRSLYNRVVRWRCEVHMSGPLLVDVAPDLAAKFVKEAQDDAAAQYDRFVAKLVRKIGACESAVLAGNHVWGWSVLTVTKATDTERWKTQQIVNFSKLGKLFNQWPTRKLK